MKVKESNPYRATDQQLRNMFALGVMPEWMPNRVQAAEILKKTLIGNLDSPAKESQLALMTEIGITFFPSDLTIAQAAVKIEAVLSKKNSAAIKLFKKHNIRAWRAIRDSGF